MRRKINEPPPIISRINVTPIIDVALVLVIILLVTAPLISVAGLPVDLPQARTREAEGERNVSVTLSANGTLAVDDLNVQRQDLRDTVRRRLAEPGNDHVLLVVRADASVPFSSVRAVLDDLRDAGAQRVAIATRQKLEDRR